jgi:hypothetical protein
MFESRRRARTEVKKNLKRSAILALAATVLFSVGVASAPYLCYFAIVLFILALGLLFAGGGTWSVGAVGEEKVAGTLAMLGDPFHVVHDVFLPNTRGNIDHVVIGPNGVFVLETKNNNGYIACEGDFWVQRKVGRRGTPYSRTHRQPKQAGQGKSNAIEKVHPEPSRNRSIH